MNKAFVKEHVVPLTMVVFTLLVFGLGILVISDKMSYGIGLLVGLGISFIKLRLMENTFKKAINMSADQAKSYTQKQYMFRYLLTGVVLLGAAVVDSVSLLGVFLGLVSMKAGAYMALTFK